VVAAGGRLLGPTPEFIAIAADKQRTADALQAAKVPVPAGIRLQPGMPLPDRFAYPAVLKRLDGAGSLDICLIPDAAAAVAHGPVPLAARLERFVSGLAASVAVLCGPKSRQALSPCRQKISDDGRLVYQGGASPLDDDHVGRAQQLALDAIECLPGALGYVGVDMVLGDDPAHDVVIEINPRLSVSYVGLRAVYPGNLAQEMLALAAGHRVDLVRSTQRVDFDADGTVWCVAAKDSVA
jgi:predicted ATP-grasp superfamily ATP-dependent carboligase